LHLRGKTAIVTGASRGIGKQIAIELGRHGANVVVAARTVDRHRRLPGTIGETVDAVESAGGTALAVRVDLARRDDLSSLVEQAISHFGGIDVLVNNAADTSAGGYSIVELDLDDWLRQFDVNLHAPFTLIKAAVPSMRERGGGVIVNFTSTEGDLIPIDRTDSPGVGLGFRITYATSKAAVNRLGNVIAAELRELGIAVVSLDPGFTRTELVEVMGERGVVDPERAVPMEIPVKCVLHLVTTDDPMQYAGQVLRAAAFASEQGL
jgi:NAD(P)-dependent dehydrogenase (short-subunit alcohol dehydrogenase family)